MTTYTSALRLAQMVPGDPAVRDQWGTILDNTIAVIEQAITGSSWIDLTGQTAYALTVANNAPDQARQMILPFYGTLTAPCGVWLPQVTKLYMVQNYTTGGQPVVLTTGISGGTNLVIPQGLSAWIMTDSSGVWQPVMADSTPIGALQAFAGAAAPPRWLLCDGSWVSRAQYALLFQTIGTTYGAADGANYFALPDMRGRSMFGLDNMGTTGAAGRITGQSGMPGTTLGGAGGSELQQYHAHNVYDPSHTHGVNDPTHAHGVYDPGHSHGAYANVGDGGHSHGVNDAGHAHYYSMYNVAGIGGYGSNALVVSSGSSPVTSTNATGISIQGSGSNISVSVGTYGSGTGIGIYGAGTGISNQWSGTGIGIYATGGGSSQNMPPAMMVNVLIYAGA